MKKIFLSIFALVILFSTLTTNSYYEYSDYTSDYIAWFVNSPDKSDLDRIENKIIKRCEEIYLEATRRRDYTELELKYCSWIFDIKRQQEIAYLEYYSWH